MEYSELMVSLIEFLKNNLDLYQVEKALDEIWYTKAPLCLVDSNLENKVYDLIQEFADDNGLDAEWCDNLFADHDVEDFLLEIN